MTLAVIPCRSGSKRIPRKNWEKVGGTSLLDRAVFCARDAGLSAIIVTDDPAACAGKQATVLTEPPELAADDVTMAAVLTWVLDHCYQSDGGAVTLLQPTSPFRTGADVTACLSIMERTGCDSVVSMVARNRGANTHWQQTIHGYERNGAVYVTTPAVIRSGACIGGWTQFYVMPPERSIDVDTRDDLAEARQIAGDAVGCEHPELMWKAGRSFGENKLSPLGGYSRTEVQECMVCRATRSRERFAWPNRLPPGEWSAWGRR